MKIHSSAVIALMLPSYAATQCIDAAGYDFHINGECNLENFKASFQETVFDNPLRNPSCSHSIDAELALQLDTTEVGLAEAVKVVCKAAQDAKPTITLDEIPYERDGAKFVERYYDGGTNWNIETETLLYPSDGETPEQVLRTDAARVKSYYESAQDEPFVWPDLPQFDLDKCALKSAMCCWPQDRQANDNNGNCAKPYDDNCVDRDPGDNTDLCSADLSYAPENNFISANGFTRYRHNNEGPIHCHGFAWANDEQDTISRYKANNLFYVSMYDHMHQRGYVRNIPGAPMCGCQETMPIASRSDCTQVDVTERYRFEKTADGWEGEIEQADLDFNACQAAGGNNDLEDYYQRLVDEGKVTAEQQTEFKKYIVGDNQCDDVFPTLMDNKGLAHGSSAEGIVKFDEGRWTFIVGEGKLAQPEKQILNGLTVTELIRQSKFPIIKRVCPSCDGTHATIYYRRLTDIPDDLDILDLVMNNWFDTYANTFNEDFALYSTYEDAVLDNEVNRWTFCNFNDAGIGFPRDCGPTGHKSNQWNSYYRGGGKASDHAFYVLTNPDFDETELRNIAAGKTIYQSSTGWGGLAERAVDGFTVGIGGWGAVTHTNWQVGAWWSVWLGADAAVDMVYVWNRIDCCRDRVGGIRVELLDGINGGNVVAFKDFPATVVWNSLPMYAFDFEGKVGQTIRLRHTSGANKVVSVAEVIVTGDIDESEVQRNVAVGKTATQSSTCHGGVASRAVDGSIASSWNYGSVTHSCYNGAETWWEVDLGEEQHVTAIHVTNRYDCCWDRLNNFIVEVYDFKDEVVYKYQHGATTVRGETITIEMPDETYASKVKVSLEGQGRILSLAEVQVFGRGFWQPSAAPSLSFEPTSAPTGAPSSSPSSAPTSNGNAALTLLQKYNEETDSDVKDQYVQLAIEILKTGLLDDSTRRALSSLVSLHKM